jgi:hypothetical protein
MRILCVEKVIVVFDSTQLEIRFFEIMFTFQVDFVEGQHGRDHFGPFDNFVKVFNVFDLARLSDSVTLFFEALFLIKLHCFLSLIKVTRVEEEAADESTCSSFSMIAMNNAYVADVLQQMFHNDFADDEQCLKLRCFVVLPIERMNVRQLIIVYFPPTHVDDLISLFVVFLQKL